MSPAGRRFNARLALGLLAPPGLDLAPCLVSEKLAGMRAYWAAVRC